MHQIGVQHFELDGIPQAVPGAAEHPIRKLAPQLAEGGFNALPHLTEHELVGWGLVAGDQQHLGILHQAGGARQTAIAQITQRDILYY